MDIELDKFDESVFLTLNGEHYAFLDPLMLTASNKLSLIPLFIFCAIISIGYFKKQKEGYHPYMNYVIILSILSLQFFLCFNILPELFKSLLLIERPCANPELSSSIRLLGIECKNTHHSFFAYKAGLVLCLTTFLFCIIKEGFKAIKWLLVIWCIIVSYSRVYVGAYYPMNILVSDFIGIVIGYLGYRLYIYLRYNLFVI
jgi:undecaprenyl-diphosphatase